MSNWSTLSGADDSTFFPRTRGDEELERGYDFTPDLNSDRQTVHDLQAQQCRQWTPLNDEFISQPKIAIIL